MSFLEDTIKQITSYFNEFEKKIFMASLDILNSDNTLKYHFFAMGIREVIRIFLERNAPDDEVKNCSWYEAFYYDKNANKEITRMQRMVYSICGGISVVNIKKELNIDIEKSAKELRNKMDQLSKYVHIDKEVVDRDSDKNNIIGVLKILETFLCQITKLRDNFCETYEKYMMNVIDEELVSNTICEIDIIATHYEEAEFELDDIKVKEINSKKLTLEIEGTLGVIHQYGSNSDNRNNDGSREYVRYPTKCNIKLAINKVFQCDFNSFEFEKWDVNTDSFFK